MLSLIDSANEFLSHTLALSLFPFVAYT